MMEIERKILDINTRAVEAAIKKLKPAPQKIFQGLVRVSYFDFPDGRIRKKRDLLRVREFFARGEKPYTELVYKIYKGVKHGCKYFDECELVIASPGAYETLAALFLRIGLKKSLYYEKKRTLYRTAKIQFEIDEHPKIPPFIEIEAKSPQHIDQAIKRLKLKDHEQTAESIAQLMERKYTKIKLNGLTFL